MVQKRRAAQLVAKKQIQEVDGRLNNPEAGCSRPRMDAAAVLSGSISTGWKTVYPGKSGELVWLSWQGRYVSIALFSMTYSTAQHSIMTCILLLVSSGQIHSSAACCVQPITKCFTMEHLQSRASVMVPVRLGTWLECLQ